MQNMKQDYNIEQIHNKYYIFNSLIMQFEKEPFMTFQEAEDYINDIINMCEIMCN